MCMEDRALFPVWLSESVVSFLLCSCAGQEETGETQSGRSVEQPILSPLGPASGARMSHKASRPGTT